MKTFGKEQTKYTYCARNKKEEMDQTQVFTKRQNYPSIAKPFNGHYKRKEEDQDQDWPWEESLKTKRQRKDIAGTLSTNYQKDREEWKRIVGGLCSIAIGEWKRFLSSKSIKSATAIRKKSYMYINLALIFKKSFIDKGHIYNAINS